MIKENAPTESKPIKPARELAAMVKKLPKEDRLRVEGVIAGLELAQKAAPATRAAN